MRLANEASPLQLDAGGFSRSETICSGSQSYQPGIAGLQRDSYKQQQLPQHISLPQTPMLQYINILSCGGQVAKCRRAVRSAAKALLTALAVQPSL